MKAVQIVPVQPGVDRQGAEVGFGRLHLEVKLGASRALVDTRWRTLGAQTSAQREGGSEPVKCLPEHSSRGAVRPGTPVRDERPAVGLRRPAVGGDGVTRLTAHLERLLDQADRLPPAERVPLCGMLFGVTQGRTGSAKSGNRIPPHDLDLAPSGLKRLRLKPLHDEEKHDDGGHEYRSDDPTESPQLHEPVIGMPTFQTARQRPGHDIEDRVRHDER